MPIHGYDEVGKVSDSEMWILVLIKAAQGFAVRRTPVRRSRKPAENAEQGQKDHFWTDNNYPATASSVTRRQASPQDLSVTVLTGVKTDLGDKSETHPM